ncbi:MAG: hypothetical protein M5U08_16480 [Burkholderiales bacterium]|nr:hypothetical protein [Burkholderiales bacterium]
MALREAPLPPFRKPAQQPETAGTEFLAALARLTELVEKAADAQAMRERITKLDAELAKERAKPRQVVQRVIQPAEPPPAPNLAQLAFKIERNRDGLIRKLVSDALVVEVKTRNPDDSIRELDIRRTT